jgi:hypothetical protein
MTLAEMLDVVEDKAGFERLLQTLDVPAYAISTPVCGAAPNVASPSFSTITSSHARTRRGPSR